MTIDFLSTLTGVEREGDVLMVGFTDGEPLGKHVFGLQRTMRSIQNGESPQSSREYLEFQCEDPAAHWGGSAAVSAAILTREWLELSLTMNAARSLNGIQSLLIRFALDDRRFEQLRLALRDVFRGFDGYSEQ